MEVSAIMSVLREFLKLGVSSILLRSGPVAIPNRMRIFVAGTDTGVGKTYIATKLVEAFNAAGRPCAGFKPVACGDRDDAEALWKAGPPSLELDRINPVWLKTPASPYIATRLENRPSLPLDPLIAGYHWLADRFENIIVEGAGGWLTPLAPGLTMASLAQELGLPVLLVSANRLGTLNHTLLSLESIQRSKIHVFTIILNAPTTVGDASTETNVEVLRELVHPVLVHSVPWRSVDLPEDFLCQMGLHSVQN